MTVQGVIRENSIFVEQGDLKPYEGMRVTVILPNRPASRDLEARTEKRLRYFSEKAKGKELTPRSVEEIDQYIQKMRGNDRV